MDLFQDSLIFTLDFSQETSKIIRLFLSLYKE